MDFATKADVEAYAGTPPSYLRIAGYHSAGDLGAALYMSVASEPSHAGKIKTAANDWYEIAEPVLTPYMFGAFGTGATDDAGALTGCSGCAVAQGRPYAFYEGSFFSVTNVTLDGSIIFRGGLLRPHDGTTVELAGEVDAPGIRIVDTSSGGTLTGSGPIVEGYIFTEWFGADPSNAAFNSQSAIQEAVDFAGQRNPSGGDAPGGTIKFLQGYYFIEAAIIVQSRGVKFHGSGVWSTIIYKSGNTDAFHVIGALDQSKAALGFEAKDFQIKQVVGQQPTNGACFFMVTCQQFVISNILMTDYYRGIDCYDCQGSLVKEIKGCNFVTPGDWTTPSTGSVNILLRGIPRSQIDAGGSLGTGLCERFYILHNTGTNIGIEYGFLIQAADTSHVVSNHFAGNKQAVLFIVSDQSSIYNMHFANNTWEGLLEHSSYAVFIQRNSALTEGLNVNSMMFVNEQILNGQVSGIYVGGSNGLFAKNITFSNCDIIQTYLTGVHIHSGKHIRFMGCSFTDGDYGSNVHGTSTYLKVGVSGGSVPLDDVIISNNQMSQENSPPFAASVDHGIEVLSGTRLNVSNNSIENATIPIFSEEAGLNLVAENNEVTLSTIDVTSAATINLPIGEKLFRLVGSTTVENIGAVGSSGESETNGREVELRADSALTISNNGSGTGNIRLNGGVDWAMPAGGRLLLRYEPHAEYWYEVSRFTL